MGPGTGPGTRPLLVLLLAVGLALAALLLPAAPAGAAEEGLLRVAHLSPDSPAVDVTLDAPGGAAAPVTLTGLGYGTVTDHLPVAPGTWTVSLRAAGADPAGPPVLSTTVDVRPGTARTVAGVGAFADLDLAVLPDDLSLPPPGTARVRLLAAAAGAPALDAAVPGAPPLAADLAFGAGGGYVDVPGGRTTLRVAPAGGPPVEVPLDLAAGTVSSLLVLDREGGGLDVRPVRDATTAPVVPVGGVEAGAGGTAAPSPLGSLLALVAAAVHGGAPPATAVPAPAAPVRVRVPAIGVDSPLARLGTDPSGALVPSADPALAGWFASGPAPGEPGPAVLAGHVDSSRGPAVFFRLRELAPGDEVLVDRADGTTARFVVTAVARHPKAAFPAAEVYAPTPDAQLRLITCGGAFDREARSYLDNVVVSARAT
ncbi:class F sortase [Geodermatophilus sp. SYSU D00815]